MSLDFSCEDCEELLPDYILQALSPDEMASVAIHIRTCLRCQEKFLVYEDVFSDISHIPTKYNVPDSVWNNIYKIISNDIHEENNKNFVEKLKDFFFLRIRWSAIITTTGIAVIVSLCFWIFDLHRQSVLLQAKIQNLQEDRQKQQQISAFLMSPEMRRVLLRGEAKASQATGTILVQPQEIHGILIVKDLPILPGNRVYQFWMIRDKKRENGGIFRVDSSGMGLLILNAASPFSTYSAFGITEEPEGGSDGPTSPRLLGGRF